MARLASREPPSSPAPTEEAAQLPADQGSPAEPAAGDAPADQTTPAEKPAEKPAPAWRAKLTAEEREAARLDLLREADPDEISKVNDRFDGYVGKRLQVTRAQEQESASARAIADQRAKALETRDPEEALAALEGMTQQERKAAGDSAFAESIRVHEALLANPHTKEFALQFAGKNYGSLAQGDGVVASILHRADLAGFVDKLPEIEKAIRASVEKELIPVLTKRIRAQLRGEEEPEDRGSAAGGGGGEWKSLAELRAAIKAMPLAEYQRREAEIDAATIRLQRVRAA